LTQIVNFGVLSKAISTPIIVPALGNADVRDVKNLTWEQEIMAYSAGPMPRI